MSDKKLVVVESPAKAKTINKYLGKDYIVEASVGHIKNLITYGLGIDIKNDFTPKYAVIKGKKDIIKKIQQLAEKVSEVLIATDPDREGEAIAYHIAEEVKPKNQKISRVLFNEITKSGIQKGLNEPRTLDDHLFNSQQARRVMDRIIGYKVSPFVSNALVKKTSEALSAGRVQSVALRLICEREEEIQAFVPVDYWSIMGTFIAEPKKTFKAKLVAIDGKTIKNPDGSKVQKPGESDEQFKKRTSQAYFIESYEQSRDLIDKIRSENYKISEVNKKRVKRNPQAPFTTSVLQQEASKRLGYSNKKTMSVAQKLYEGVNLGTEGAVGLITYMRTDSVRVSPEAQVAAQSHITKTYGAEYIPEKPPIYASKSTNVQDAHEAVRPTSLEYTPASVKRQLDKDSAALYELIYNRFVASQMKPAQYDQTTIEIEGGKFLFRVTGSVLVFKGFLAAYEDINEDKNSQSSDQPEKDTDVILPEGLTKGLPLVLNNVESTKSQTKPAARFNPASLVKELDDKGIGRPSTYASIVSTLTDRNYVDLTNKVFIPTELGIDVNKILVKNFPNIFNVAFTAGMEEELDEIAEGRKTYLSVMNEFYDPFTTTLDKALEETKEAPEFICDKCGSPMVIRVSRKGRFLGCTNYPTCSNTMPLPKNAAKAEPVLAEGITCDLCGKPMFIRESRYGSFYGCSDYPKCKGIKKFGETKSNSSAQSDPSATAADGNGAIHSHAEGVTCPKCHEGKLLKRFSKKTRKNFWGCSNYPKCDYLTNHEPVDQKCTNCGNYYLEIRFKKVDGDWAKSMQCPQCQEKYEIPETATA